jgi:hypothetical protein
MLMDHADTPGDGITRVFHADRGALDADLAGVGMPAPFSPTMPVIAPFSMRSDTPRTACTLPNDFWMP